MTHFLEYLATLLHLIGIVLFVGGHVWFALFSARTERYHDEAGQRFLVACLPLLANVFGVSVLLLFGSGCLRLLVWGEPGLIFLPDPYGWIMVSKLLLYMIIVGNGLLIERRYLPQAVRDFDEYSSTTRAQMPSAWGQITMRARLNLVLILVVVALGEALRYSRL